MYLPLGSLWTSWNRLWSKSAMVRGSMRTPQRPEISMPPTSRCSGSVMRRSSMYCRSTMKRPFSSLGFSSGTPGLLLADGFRRLHGCGGAAEDRLFDRHRRDARAREEDAVSARVEVHVGMPRLEESERVDLEAEGLRDLRGALPGRDADGEHHHVHEHLERAADQGVLAFDEQLLARVEDLGDAPPDVVDPVLLHALPVEILPEAESADVDVDHVDLDVLEELLQLDPLLDAHAAADRAAPGIGRPVSRSHAEDEPDSLGRPAVAADDPSIRKHALELVDPDHVGGTAVLVAGVAARVEVFEPGRHDDRLGRDWLGGPRDPDAEIPRRPLDALDDRVPVDGYYGVRLDAADERAHDLFGRPLLWRERLVAPADRCAAELRSAFDKHDFDAEAGEVSRRTQAGWATADDEDAHAGAPAGRGGRGGD